MEDAFLNFRGWDVSLRQEATLRVEEKTAFLQVIGKYLTVAERRGWEVGAASAKEYVELVEGLRESGGRWEEGREALRWLVRYMKSQAEGRGGGPHRGGRGVAGAVGASAAGKAVCGADGGDLWGMDVALGGVV
jgi:hypothetical protein